MEKAEISRLINSFNAIKGYFDTTKRYMPQIAKLVVFIEDVIPLLETIHQDLNQSTSLIPAATSKLDKVTSATELAATEVMNIVDRVIEKLNSMNARIDGIDETVDSGADISSIKSMTAGLRGDIDASQEDLFSIMNALQFQDITTQQINAIGSTIATVHEKLAMLLKGFENDGIDLGKMRNVAFDPDAEFDFDRSAESQKIADALIQQRQHVTEKKDASEVAPVDSEAVVDAVVFDDDGQPDISSLMDTINNKKG